LTPYGVAASSPYPSQPVPVNVASSAAARRGVDYDTPRTFFRQAAGQQWEDRTLAEWSQNDFRIFCGDLGNEVNDDTLKNAFAKYPSFLKAKVIRDKQTTKSKGFGFVSFSDPRDYVKAMREMNGRYIGNRPVKLRKSRWQDFNDDDRMNAAQKQTKRQKGGNKKKGKKGSTSKSKASTSARTTDT